MSLLSYELTAVDEECRRGHMVRFSPSVDADGVSHISHPLPSTILAPRSSGVITQQSDDLPFFRLWPGYLHHDLVSNKTTVEDDDTSYYKDSYYVHEFGELSDLLSYKKDSDHGSRPYILELEGFVNFIQSAEFWPAVALAKLPGELISIIVDFLLSAEPERCYLTQERECLKERLNTLSRTSLVCRSWWIIQRPKLFAKLELKSTEDVHFLLGMLRSPANQWLPAVIAELLLDVLDVRDASIDRYFNFLTRKLFNLRNFRILCHVYTARGMGVLSPSLRPCIASCYNVSHLTLSGLSFFSLSALSHALEGMSHLEELDVYQLFWINTPERPPTRMSLASFPRLRRVEDHGGSTWMFLWLYAPFLARHCKRPSEEMTFDNPYVRLLKHVIATFNDPHPGYEAVLIGAHTFQLKYKILSLLQCVYEVQLWPSDSGAASAIRNVKVLCKREYFAKTNWSLVDSFFAEEVVTFETMAFYYDDHEGRTPKERFPKLCQLGKLNFKREEQWDGLYSGPLPTSTMQITSTPKPKFPRRQISPTSDFPDVRYLRPCPSSPRDSTSRTHHHRSQLLCRGFSSSTKSQPRLLFLHSVSSSDNLDERLMRKGYATPLRSRQ